MTTKFLFASALPGMHAYYSYENISLVATKNNMKHQIAVSSTHKLQHMRLVSAAASLRGGRIPFI